MDAIILIDKPAGIASAEVVRRIKARTKAGRVGHLGTLDPFATGLLPIMIGEATKLAPFLETGRKQYEGIIRLGIETDTLDRTGETVATAEVPALEAAVLARVAARFTGTIEQVPPIFSAIKRQGVRLYQRARRGEEVEPPPSRQVEIRRLALEPADPTSIRFSLECSPGTYIRSLARDIGVALGTVAHLAELRRTRNGPFSIADASPLDRALDVLRGGAGEATFMVQMRQALADMPEAQADPIVEGRIRCGDSRALDTMIPAGAEVFKVVRGDRLLAIARADTPAKARLIRVFAVGEAG